MLSWQGCWAFVDSVNQHSEKAKSFPNHNDVLVISLSVAIDSALRGLRLPAVVS